MLRWCLSTVRTFGGHDTCSRSSRFLSSHPLRLAKSWFLRPDADATVPVTDFVKVQDTPIVASVHEQPPLTGPQGRPTADTDASGGTPSWASLSAVETLKRFLSSANLTSDHPLVYSSNTIRSLYYCIESGGQLAMLDSKMLTLLMSLFGSLSTDPRTPTMYRHPLASHCLDASRHRSHWTFIRKIGRYKSESGMAFQGSDRFWLMRAELSIVSIWSPLGPLSRDAYSAVLRARTHYHVIRRHSHHPEVHAYYLETLLSTRDPRLLDFAACDLSFLLRNHRMCHPRLQCLLYRLVVQHGGDLQSRSQEAILAALWVRACQRAGNTSNRAPEGHDYILDTATIVRSLSAALFGSASRFPSNISPSSLGHLLSVFSPACSFPLRWNSLFLLSISNTSELLHLNEARWVSDHTMPQVIAWQVIFGLAAIEKIVLQVPSLDLATQSIPGGALETTRTLYKLWLPIIKSCAVSRDLACAVTTSFLRLACALADATLFYECQELYRIGNCMTNPPTPVQNRLTAQYIAAAIRVQGSHPSAMLAALEGFSLDLEQQQHVLTFLVEALIAIDAPLAYTIYTVVQGKGMELDPGVLFALAMSCARRGAFSQAIIFLNDSRLSLEKRGILVSAIARTLREHPRIRHSRSVFVAISDKLAALYHSHVPPEHFRGHLEQLFVILAQYGRGSQLFTVVFSIFKRFPNFFQSRFFVRYCHALIRHRQFCTARKLLNTIVSAHPRIARSLRILIDRTATRTKAFRVFKRITPFHDPTSLRLSSHRRRYPLAGPPLELLLQELLKSGRVLAAKRIFICAATAVSPRQCTILGNIILHGVSRQPRSRNGRRVRKVLALLENLVKDHGFRPDRVTANILVKAIVSWRSAVDSVRLRELFDQLVRGGYPAAEYSSLRPPFDTRQTHFSGSSGFSELPPFISFEKHTRPLFKMFIKAFYLCNDVEAARKVVGILKVEEHKNAIAKKARQKARSRGRIEAGQRSVTSLNAVVASID